jgi:hypothetical protein
MKRRRASDDDTASIRKKGSTIRLHHSRLGANGPVKVNALVRVVVELMDAPSPDV